MDKRAEKALAMREELCSDPELYPYRDKAEGRRVIVGSDFTFCYNDNCPKCPQRFKCKTEEDLYLTRNEWQKMDQTRGTGKKLEGWKDAILKEMPFVDIKPFSHNIIILALGAIARGWGKKQANKVIKDFGLNQLGWYEESTD